MSDPGSAPTALYRAAEVARLLRCSEWWLKEQARQRRIPFCWIGGSYVFTAEHIAEIVRRSEVRPAEGLDATQRPASARRPRVPSDGSTVVRLQARTPRRARETGASNMSAA